MRVVWMLVFCLAPWTAPPAAADEADDFFEVGLGYLKSGFYREARAAFAESLVRAPGEAVPTAFTALACAAEGRDTRSCAYLVRLAYKRLPAKRNFQVDWNKVLGGKSNRARIEKAFQVRLKDTKGSARIDTLVVLAFLQIHDGPKAKSPALAMLRKEKPDDALVVALTPPKAKKKKAPSPS